MPRLPMVNLPLAAVSLQQGPLAEPSPKIHRHCQDSAVIAAAEFDARPLTPD